MDWPIISQLRSLSEMVGGWTILFVKTLKAIYPFELDYDEFMNQFYKIGILSLPVMIATAAFVGALMVIQTGNYVRSTGATAYVGTTAAVAVFSQLGPVMLGLMFSGRVGANNTAELGTMAVTEQIDAMRMLAIDPVKFLVLPRFLVMLLVMFLLAGINDLVALIFGAITAQGMLGIDYRIYWQGVFSYHHLGDFLLGIVKSVFFGASISIISCYYGMKVKGGATGVGRAVNDSVVASAMAIFVIDFIITVLWI